MSSEGSGEITVDNNGGLGGRGKIISTACDHQSSHSHFPEGLRVLLIDDDRVCLSIVSQMLKKCRYQVTATSYSREALTLLKKKEDEFDIVFTNVQMDEIDGFKMLEAGLELDLPVVMMSSNDNTEIIMKGIRHGARDYLIKPLRMAEIKNIWQHVYRKNIFPCSIFGSPQLDVEFEFDFETDNIVVDVPTSTKSTNNKINNKKIKAEGSCPEKAVSGGGKRERIKWSQSLHGKFVDAVEKAGGLKKAVPKQILEGMGTENITREQVASHLQKFRKIITKKQNLETRNKLIRVLPPPPLPVNYNYNSNYSQFGRGPIVGPAMNITATTNNNNMIYSSVQPQRAQLMNNWMVHGGCGYNNPQPLQANRTMMMVQPLPNYPLPQIGSNNFQNMQTMKGSCNSNNMNNNVWIQADEHKVVRLDNLEHGNSMYGDAIAFDELEDFVSLP